MNKKEMLDQGIEFLEKYKKLGYVTDIYSDNWFASQDPAEYCLITPEDLARLDSEKGRKYRGHLLAIYLGDKNQDLIRELRGIYKPFDDYCNIKTDGWRNSVLPSLLFVNLDAREILCLGLGYKNRIFHFELSKFIHAHKNNSLKDSETQCDERFYAQDYCGVISRTVECLESLGRYYYEYDSLKGNADVAVTISEDDGLYYFDDYDDEGMTKDEVEELIKEYEKYSEWIDDCVSDLRPFFPMIEVWDLNSGAY